MFIGLVLGFLLATVLFMATGGMLFVCGIGCYLYNTRNAENTDG